VAVYWRRAIVAVRPRPVACDGVVVKRIVREPRRSGFRCATRVPWWSATREIMRFADTVTGSSSLLGLTSVAVT
jgi:hypothetical protein